MMPSSLSLSHRVALFALLLAPGAFAQEPPAAPSPPENRRPVLHEASLTVDEDEKASGVVRASDPDGDALRYRVTRGPQRGDLQLEAETGKLEYTPRKDFHGDDAFTVEVSDGKLQASTTVKVVVRPRNDAPVATGAAVSLAEDTPASGTFAVSDVDGDKLYFAIAKEPRGGAVAITDATKGAFQYTPRKDFHGEDAFTFEVGDGKLAARAEITLRVTAVNDAPLVTGGAFRAREEQAIEVRAGASDVDGDVVTLRVADAPAHGAVEPIDAASGRFRYTPHANFHGEDRFTVAASDQGTSATAEITVTVTPVNDAPVASLLTLSLAEDGTGEGVVSASDVDGDKLSYRVTRAAGKGEAAVDAASGKVTYEPRRDFFGADAFTVEVSDGVARTAVEVRAEVEARNDAPVTADLSLSAVEDQASDARVAGSDVDGDALAFRLARRPANGEVTIDEKTGAVRYTPRADFYGDDAFTVEVGDGRARASAKAKVRVAPVNDPPSLSALSLSTAEDAAASGALSARDPEREPLRYRLLTRARNGSAAVDEKTGAVAYTPRKDWHGEDAFTVEASDGRLAVSTQVSVRVTPVNDPPVVTGGAFRTREDEAVELRAGASDVDGDAVTFALARPPTSGSVEVLDEKTGRFRYTPRGDFHGEDRFTVAASDGRAKASADITVTVAPVNDAPVAAALTISLEEDGAGQGTLSARDVDGDKLSYRVVSGPKSGEASVPDGARGDIRYRPKPNFFGADALTIEVSDGVARAQVAVDVRIAARNDAPVARALALKTAEDTPARGLISASDIDGDKLRYRVVTPPRMGGVELEEGTGVLTYVPKQDQSGEDAFVVEVSDGEASARTKVDVEVLRVPDPPVVREQVIETREDESVTVRLPVEDPDGDKLSFRLLSRAKRGEAVLEDASAGRLRYTPRADENGDDEVELEVSDGRHNVRAVVRLRIHPVNDAPSVAPLEMAAAEDRAASASLEGKDIDGDELVFRVHAPPKQGQVSFDKADPRRFVFEPAKNQEGTAVFEVVAFDGHATSAPASVTVRIEGANDAPQVARGQRLGTEEDKPYSGTLHAEDGDGDALSYRITRQPARGVVKLDDPRAGRFTFTPKHDVFGNDSFSFSVTDPKGASATGLVRIKVEEVDDPPVAIREYTDAPKYGRVTRKLKGFDPEGKPVTFRIVRQPHVGRVELRDEESGEYVFITDGSGNGTVQFEFVTNDGEHDSLPAAVVVRVR